MMPSNLIIVAAFSELDRLAKTVGAEVLGGSFEVNGGRLGGDYLTLALMVAATVGRSPVAREFTILRNMSIRANLVLNKSVIGWMSVDATENLHRAGRKYYARI